MALFLGTSRHQLDDKARLILPKRFLDQVAPESREFIVTAGPERCLLVMEPETWKEMSEEIGPQPIGTWRQRQMRRLFLGHAEKVKPDNAGRIVITEGLRTWADVAQSAEVVLVGTGAAIEIWSASRWTGWVDDVTERGQGLFDVNASVTTTSTSGP